MSIAKEITEIGTLAPGQWEKPGADKIGTVHGSGTLFMHAEAGKATLSPDQGDASGAVYEFGCLGFGGPGQPYVRCKKTGQWFVINWQDIINMAIAAGVSSAHPDMAGK